MSQHIFRTETNTDQYVEVQIGWDKPMQWYYCVITPVVMTGEFKGELDDDPIYSNLSEEAPSTLSLDHYIEVCREHGISLSATIIEAVRKDKHTNTVNQRTVYQH